MAIHSDPRWADYTCLREIFILGEIQPQEDLLAVIEQEDETTTCDSRQTKSGFYYTKTVPVQHSSIKYLVGVKKSKVSPDPVPERESMEL